MCAAGKWTMPLSSPRWCGQHQNLMYLRPLPKGPRRGRWRPRVSPLPAGTPDGDERLDLVIKKVGEAIHAARPGICPN